MKDVVGYEGLYAVTSCGKIWSYQKKKFLKPAANKGGYLYVYLSKDNIQKKHYIHRLVASAYLPNIDNLPQVDHIDNDKTHNYVNNLQWITNRDNVRKGRNKPVLQFDLDGNFIREWSCARDVGIEAQRNICHCLKGRTNSAYGFFWKYKE